MGDLRDALRKANVLSKKDARRLAHEERVHRSEVGRKGQEVERNEHQQELSRQQQEQRQRSRVGQEELRGRQQAQAELAACRDLLDNEVLPAHSRQGQGFFVQLGDGTMVRLSLAPAQQGKLTAGALCLVRIGPKGSHDYGLLATEHARRVHQALPDRVVWAAGNTLG